MPVAMTRFVRALEGATIAWPLNARAQQPAIPVIGFLNSASPEAFGPYVAGFRQGLPSHMQPVVALFIFKRKLGHAANNGHQAYGKTIREAVFGKTRR